LDNRPLKFDEYIEKVPQFLFVSATPSEFELKNSSTVAEQIIRPTGLLDPKIDIRDSKNQVENLYDEIKRVISRGERVLNYNLIRRWLKSLQNTIMIWG